MRIETLIGLGAALALFGAGCAPSAVTSPAANIPVQTPGEVQNVRAPHFVDSAPAAGYELAVRPLGVVINTDLELAQSSSLSVTVGGSEVGVGETEIAPDRLSLRRNVTANSPDGVYLVRYRACGSDGSCDDGQYAFSVDRERLSDYQDLRGQTTVLIKMSGLRFAPEKVIVSPGTHIIWVNDEGIPHFVSTDPHPGHNYYPAQNSTVINKGENYELTLNEEGEYLYHCSTHFSQGMLARIVVLP